MTTTKSTLIMALLRRGRARCTRLRMVVSPRPTERGRAPPFCLENRVIMDSSRARTTRWVTRSMVMRMERATVTASWWLRVNVTTTQMKTSQMMARIRPSGLVTERSTRLALIYCGL